MNTEKIQNLIEALVKEAGSLWDIPLDSLPDIQIENHQITGAPIKDDDGKDTGERRFDKLKVSYSFSFKGLRLKDLWDIGAERGTKLRINTIFSQLSEEEAKAINGTVVPISELRPQKRARKEKDTPEILVKKLAAGSKEKTRKEKEALLAEITQKLGL